MWVLSLSRACVQSASIIFFGFGPRLLRDGVARLSGAVAQLGEHLLCKQGVAGSIPTSSTKSRERKAVYQRLARLSNGPVAQVARAHP